MRKRNLIIAAALAWGLLLVGAAYWSYRNDPATVPGQTTVDQARDTMNRVITEVIAVAPQLNATVGPDSESTCEITKARDGASVAKTVSLATPPGTEADLLRQVAAKLPAAYHARVAEPDGGPTLFADAGNFVAVRGRTDSGKVTLTMTSGCREKG
jgi:predicted dienelactone hydrolase